MPIARKGSGIGGNIMDESGNVIRYGTTMRECARSLRKNMTASERVLWYALRKKQLNGLRFYRQVAIDRYVVDFYCPKKSVIVEVDGGVHDDEYQMEHDAIRSAFLQEKGFTILRVKNKEVLNYLDDVLLKIADFCGVS